jgi:hypothetical protein
MNRSPKGTYSKPKVGNISGSRDNHNVTACDALEVQSQATSTFFDLIASPLATLNFTWDPKRRSNFIMTLKTNPKVFFDIAVGSAKGT